MRQVLKFIVFWLVVALIIIGIVGGVTVAWGAADYYGLTGAANKAHLRNEVLPAVIPYLRAVPSVFAIFGSNRFIGLMSAVAAGFSAWAAIV